jgi:hypothetical protein
MRQAFALDILTFPLLRLESHRHLRTSIINSIVGEFEALLLTFLFVIRFSAVSHTVHLHILLRQPW